MSQLRYERHDKTKPLNAEENLFHTDAYVVIVKKNASAPLTKLIKDSQADAGHAQGAPGPDHRRRV